MLYSKALSGLSTWLAGHDAVEWDDTDRLKQSLGPQPGPQTPRNWPNIRNTRENNRPPNTLRSPHGSRTRRTSFLESRSGRWRPPGPRCRDVYRLRGSRTVSWNLSLFESRGLALRPVFIHADATPRIGLHHLRGHASATGDRSLTRSRCSRDTRGPHRYDTSPRGAYEADFGPDASAP